MLIVVTIDNLSTREKMSSIKKIATLAAVALIAGCGGGGDSSAPQSASMTIQGDAMKGPMAKAKISLYKTTADGKQGELLKETTSDDSGHYNAAVANYSGVMIAVASVVPGTTMYDEATKTLITPATGFQMRASFSVEAGKPFSAQINPFTELATASALAKEGGLNAANVAQAKKDMNETLGFDPLSAAPEFDATTKAPKNSAAVFLTALSQMANSGDIGCSTGDQAAKVDCVTKALTNKGLSDPILKSSLQSRVDVEVDKAGLPAVKISDPSGTPATTASAVEQARAFFGTLRSNAKALDATELSLQTELQAVADDMKNRTAPLASASVDALNVAAKGAQFWNDIIKNPSAPFVATRNFFNLSAGYYEPQGVCGFYSDTEYKILATSRADAKYVACGTALQYVQAPKRCSTVGDWCSSNWSIGVRLHPDAANASKFTVYTQTREAKQIVQTLSNGYAPASAPASGNGYPSTFSESRTHYGAAFPGNEATLTAQRDSNGQVTAVSLAGETSPAFVIGDASSSYNNSTKMWVYKPPVATVLGDKHNIALSASLSTVGELEKLAVSGSIDLIKNGAMETRIELANGSYLQAKRDATGSYSAQDGSQELLLKLKASTAGSAVAGDIKLSAFKLDASKTSYIPTVTSFSGSVQRKGISFFDGTLTGEALNHANFKSNEPRSPANVQTVRVGFIGKVIIPTRPILNVSLSVVNKATGSSATDTAELAGQYRQGPIVINLNGNTSAATNILKLDSSAGISLVIDKTKSIHPLTLGGEKVGEFSTANNRITYSDSSYEQF